MHEDIVRLYTSSAQKIVFILVELTHARIIIKKEKNLGCCLS